MSFEHKSESFQNSPLQQQNTNEEDNDQIPNPMLDSIQSVKSFNSQKKVLKCKLLPPPHSSGKRSNQFLNSPFQVTKLNKSLDKFDSDTKKQKQYKQIEGLFPLLKLVSANQKLHHVECFNGEEVIIDQRILIKDCKDSFCRFLNNDNILNFLEQDQIIQDDSPIEDVEEKIMRSSSNKKKLQMATKKVIPLLKMMEVAENGNPIQLNHKKLRSQCEAIQQLLKDQSLSQKSEHRLGVKVGQERNSLKQRAIKQSQTKKFQKEKSQEDLEYVQSVIENFKSIFFNILYGLGIFSFIIILAYMKTENSVTIFIEDL